MHSTVQHNSPSFLKCRSKFGYAPSQQANNTIRPRWHMFSWITQNPDTNSESNMLFQEVNHILSSSTSHSFRFCFLWERGPIHLSHSNSLVFKKKKTLLQTYWKCIILGLLHSFCILYVSMVCRTFRLSLKEGQNKLLFFLVMPNMNQLEGK